jgi:hypothetical protein
MFIQWYRKKKSSIEISARKMLNDDRDLSQILPEDDKNLEIPSQLVFMKGLDNDYGGYSFSLATRHIADIVAMVHEAQMWKGSWQILRLYYRGPETRAAAGIRFERMFLRILEESGFEGLEKCYEFHKHHQSPSVKPTEMPWHGMGVAFKQEYVNRISKGNDDDKIAHSKRELLAVINAVNDSEFQSFRILFPCSETWATWDAAIVLSKSRGEIHVIFLQTTTDPKHSLLSKGLNAVRDVAPPQSLIYYHYILVLLLDERDKNIQIPNWRNVKSTAKGGQDKTWTKDNLRQYVMHVPINEGCRYVPHFCGATPLTGFG